MAHAGFSKQWMVDMIGYISGKSPVIRAILKEITHGHCSMRETMHKYCFQQTFHIVHGITSRSNAEINVKQTNINDIQLTI